MKNKKFNIFKTFEIFNSEAFSILKERIINLVFIETENFFITGINESKSFLTKILDNNKEASSYIGSDIRKDNSIQLSVVGNRKVYNLLNMTLRKCKKLEEHETINS